MRVGILRLSSRITPDDHEDCNVQGLDSGSNTVCRLGDPSPTRQLKLKKFCIKSFDAAFQLDTFLALDLHVYVVRINEYKIFGFPYTVISVRQDQDPVP